MKLDKKTILHTETLPGRKGRFVLYAVEKGIVSAGSGIRHQKDAYLSTYEVDGQSFGQWFNTFDAAFHHLEQRINAKINAKRG